MQIYRLLAFRYWKERFEEKPLDENSAALWLEAAKKKAYNFFFKYRNTKNMSEEEYRGARMVLERIGPLLFGDKEAGQNGG